MFSGSTSIYLVASSSVLLIKQEHTRQKPAAIIELQDQIIDVK